MNIVHLGGERTVTGMNLSANLLSFTQNSPKPFWVIYCIYLTGCRSPQIAFAWIALTPLNYPFRLKAILGKDAIFLPGRIKLEKSGKVHTQFVTEWLAQERIFSKGIDLLDDFLSD